MPRADRPTIRKICEDLGIVDEKRKKTLQDGTRNALDVRVCNKIFKSLPEATDWDLGVAAETFLEDTSQLRQKQFISGTLSNTDQQLPPVLLPS